MFLSAIEKIMEKEWLETPAIWPNMNIELGEFQIMPDHFHVIIYVSGVSTNVPNNIPAQTHNQFGLQPDNPGSVMCGFKSSATTDARKIKPTFGWQARFHDHIIRNADEYKRISTYI